MGTPEDLQNLQDQITELDTKLSKLSGDMDSLDKSTSSFNKSSVWRLQMSIV